MPGLGKGRADESSVVGVVTGVAAVDWVVGHGAGVEAVGVGGHDLTGHGSSGHQSDDEGLHGVEMLCLGEVKVFLQRKGQSVTSDTLNVKVSFYTPTTNLF